MKGLKELLTSVVQNQSGSPSLNLASLLDSAKRVLPSLSSALGPEQQKVLAGVAAKLPERLPELISAGKKGAELLARCFASTPGAVGPEPSCAGRPIRAGNNAVAHTGVVSLAAVTGLTAVAGVVSAVALARRK